ncbi:dCTP deaminase [Marispirochaeta sp.]|uniref:dCTP deaminase n=1 Tax=Marispirochaeta sp. TaxID=2038653 RepID=UPI0029C89A46|nr:dCTP deaminase [Marispirochaeta sp.]
MAILSRSELNDRLYSKREDKIVITPILDQEAQLGETGIDLRLGNQFISFKSENIRTFDIKENMKQEDLLKLQKEYVLPFGSSYILHPQNMILCSTFEYIGLPTDIWGTIEGRSSWARIGLVIATANSIDPGFKGCITLELSNLSNVPIELYPGMRIAQLVCEKTTSSVQYSNRKYLFPIGPEFSKLGRDKDIEIFTDKI